MILKVDGTVVVSPVPHPVGLGSDLHELGDVLLGWLDAERLIYMKVDGSLYSTAVHGLARTDLGEVDRRFDRFVSVGDGGTVLASGAPGVAIGNVANTTYRVLSPCPTRLFSLGSGR